MNHTNVSPALAAINGPPANRSEAIDILYAQVLAERRQINLVTTAVVCTILVIIWVGSLVAFKYSDYLGGLVLSGAMESSLGQTRSQRLPSMALPPGPTPEIMITQWPMEDVIINQQFGQDKENYRRPSQWERDCGVAPGTSTASPEPPTAAGAVEGDGKPQFLQILHHYDVPVQSPPERKLRAEPKRSLSMPELQVSQGEEATLHRLHETASAARAKGRGSVVALFNTPEEERAVVLDGVLLSEQNELVYQTQLKTDVYGRRYRKRAEKRFSVGNARITEGFAAVDRDLALHSRFSLATGGSFRGGSFRGPSGGAGQGGAVVGGFHGDGSRLSSGVSSLGSPTQIRRRLGSLLPPPTGTSAASPMVDKTSKGKGKSKSGQTGESQKKKVSRVSIPSMHSIMDAAEMSLCLPTAITLLPHQPVVLEEVSGDNSPEESPLFSRKMDGDQSQV